MATQQRGIGRETMRKLNLLSFKRLKVHPNSLRGEMVSNRFRKDDAESFIHGNEMAVKCRIMGLGEAKPVPRIQSLLGIFCPPNYMACGQ